MGKRKTMNQTKCLERLRTRDVPVKPRMYGNLVDDKLQWLRNVEFELE
jgi:hypothetical protein